MVAKDAVAAREAAAAGGSEEEQSLLQQGNKDYEDGDYNDDTAALGGMGAAACDTDEDIEVDEPAIVNVPQWRIQASLFLLAFKNQPSEPHLTDILESSLFSFSDKDVNARLFPITTYSFLAALPIMGLLAPALGHAPLVILGALARLLTRLLLLFGRSLGAIQLAEAAYGVGAAGEILLFSYVYGTVKRSKFFAATSRAKAAFLAGQFFSAVVSDILLLGFHASLQSLLWISGISVLCACFIVFSLPALPTTTVPFKPAILALTAHFRTPSLAPFSLIWVGGIAAISLIVGYETSWYQEIAPSKILKLNGTVYALTMATGVGAALASDSRVFKPLHSNFPKTQVKLGTSANDTTLSMFSFVFFWCTMIATLLVVISGALTFVAALAKKTLSWPLLLITILSFPILYGAWSAVDTLFWSAAAAAAAMNSQSAAATYGPLFSCLYFASLVLSFVLQLVLLDERGLALSVATSFKIMGMFMVLIGIGAAFWNWACWTPSHASNCKVLVKAKDKNEDARHQSRASLPSEFAF